MLGVELWVIRVCRRAQRWPQEQLEATSGRVKILTDHLVNVQQDARPISSAAICPVKPRLCCLSCPHRGLSAPKPTSCPHLHAVRNNYRVGLAPLSC